MLFSDCCKNDTVQLCFYTQCFLSGARYGYHYDEESGDQSSKEWFSKNIDVANKEVRGSFLLLMFH